MKKDINKILIEASRLKSPFKVEKIGEVINRNLPDNILNEKTLFSNLKNLIIMISLTGFTLIVLISLIFNIDHLKNFYQEKKYIPETAKINKDKSERSTTTSFPAFAEKTENLSTKKESKHSKVEFNKDQTTFSDKVNNKLLQKMDMFTFSELSYINSDINKYVISINEEDFNFYKNKITEQKIFQYNSNLIYKNRVSENEYLTLSKQALEKLGFSFGLYKINYQALTPHGKLDFWLSHMNYGVRINSLSNIISLKTEEIKGYYPVFITWLNGSMNLKWRFSTENKNKMSDEYFYLNMDQLIPVYIEYLNPKIKVLNKGWIVWFMPDDEFFNLVNEGVNVKSFETETVKLKYKTVIHPVNETEVFNTEKFSRDFKNKLTIYPNPVKEYFNISFSISEFATGEIKLFSFDGKEVYEFYSNIALKSGKNELELKTPQIASGVYLLQLRIDNEIFAIRRILIN